MYAASSACALTFSGAYVKDLKLLVHAALRGLKLLVYAAVGACALTFSGPCVKDTPHSCCFSPPNALSRAIVSCRTSVLDLKLLVHEALSY